MATPTNNAVLLKLRALKAQEDLAQQIDTQSDDRIRRSMATQLIENDWTIGSGATPFFRLFGDSTENYRVDGLNPMGKSVVLWECRPDSTSGADGGWFTQEFAIENNQTYRFSVFVKTNNDSGKTYFGCQDAQVCDLNTTTLNENPYFRTGFLPSSNKWYLYVGYVFPAGATGLSVEGGVYDVSTGEKVANMGSSFNWAPGATKCYHRCYHVYNTDTSTRQWMYHPRVDLVDGNEPSIMALLGFESTAIVGIDGFANRRVENKFGGAVAISNIKEGRKADGSFNTPVEIGLGNVENKSSATIRNELTLENIVNTNLSAADVGLGNVENKSLSEIKSEVCKSTGVQLIENDWTLGQGSTPFFNYYGLLSENCRVLGLNPKGEESILWECRPDSASDGDGGWNTDMFDIDKDKTYRFSVFVKTNSDSGRTYFGCAANSVCDLNTTSVNANSEETKNSNPYFWWGDLPENDKWYLIVAYVFPTGLTNLSVKGGIYDAETGRKVDNMTWSFNWAPDATISYHRCYHFYDTNINTRQWMYAPRVDLLDGNEPSIMALLGRVAAEDIKYTEGETLQSLKPSAAGADVTGDNIAADTENVNGVSASTVKGNAESGKEAMNVLDAKERTWDDKISEISKSASGELQFSINPEAPSPTVLSGAMLTDTQRSDNDINSLADGRISTKVGSDTLISNLKLGKDSLGNDLYDKARIGLSDVENKSLSEIKSEVRKSTGVQLIENDWTLGNGSTPFFAINGYSSENYRVLDTNPMGEEAIIWECRPSSASSLNDGGWNTQECDVDKDKTYRFTVFVKRNNTYGTTYFGVQGYRVCTLNTSTKYNSSYFWTGDLPSTNKWYLLVGYVFPAGKTGLATTGGIYDCTTGAKAANITKSFNWASDTLKCYHRCYHGYNTYTASRQWMYNPRLDLVDGNEPSIMTLIGRVHAEDVKFGNGTTSVEDEISNLDTRVSGVENSANTN